MPEMPKKIEYPYLPESRDIKFVPADNEFMQEAKKMADECTGCSWWPTGGVLVKDGKIIGRGANSGNLIPLCPRVENEYPSGEGYHHCKDDCEQLGHSEITTVDNAIAQGNNPKNADLYLYGHWWCCKPCWDHMQKHGVGQVYLIENADKLFDRVSRQELMKEIKKRTDAGETIELKDITWNK